MQISICSTICIGVVCKLYMVKCHNKQMANKEINGLDDEFLSYKYDLMFRGLGILEE